ncbi:MAG: hypothetical protein C0501_20650 [Isosphaera sp.]|nr:hypothetical protein [Isosphaera sp.]
MRRAAILLFALWTCYPECRPLFEKGPSTKLVRGLAAYGESSAMGDLDRYGAAAFPAYEVILSDPKSTPREVAGVLAALARVKGPREPFLPHALRRLAHPDEYVRGAAAGFVIEIGTAAESPVLVALLSSEDEFISRRAARTLAQVGGPTEVDAMDAWLRTGSAHRDFPILRDRVRTYRDELDARVRGVNLAPPPREK